MLRTLLLSQGEASTVGSLASWTSLFASSSMCRSPSCSFLSSSSSSSTSAHAGTPAPLATTTTTVAAATTTAASSATPGSGGSGTGLKAKVVIDQPELVDVTKGGAFDVADGIRIVKAHALSAFDESIEVTLKLNIDPKRVTVRGTAQLPKGLGKTVRVVVFANGEKAIEALEAGAHVVGGTQLIEDIKKGTAKLDFEKAIATPDMENELKAVARILGPKGLMPSPKRGTVTTEVGQAVKALLQPFVDFRADKGGVVHAAVGKASWKVDDVIGNISALVEAVQGLKLKTKAKARLITGASLCTTHGPGVPLDPLTIDPKKRAAQLRRV